MREVAQLQKEPDLFREAVPAGIVAGVTGVILAGGASSRMGSNKALLPHQGGRFIESIYRQLRGIFAEVIVVTDTAEQYGFLPCRKVPDRYRGGALAGIHAGLAAAATEAVFAVACDMPYLDPLLIRHIVARGREADLSIPLSDKGYEPLHALYSKRCLPVMERCLAGGRLRIVSILAELKVREVSAAEVALFDPDFRCFSNINTPSEYYALRGKTKGFHAD